jgi:UDP-N-acetylmuramoyl-L-alanyl-D-glutamate--2,6-diaminopimelate ligase
MATFADITAKLTGARSGPQEVEISSVCADSRQAKAGALFVAIHGEALDGHQFLPDAIARGAAGVVLEKAAWLGSVPEGVASLVVPDARIAAALVAAEFWRRPSDELVLVSVTGTNGKTTVSHLTDGIFRAAGHRTGIIGTLGRTVAGAHTEASRTTPDAMELQQLLREMRDAQVTHVSMEVSSHALELHRVYGCSFDAAIFTNLTQDHLDFHQTEEAYFQAKLRLFTEYADAARPRKQMVAIVNADDEGGRRIAAGARCRVLTYAVDRRADVWAEEVAIGLEGIRFRLRAEGVDAPVRLQLFGRFNLYNALAAAACALGLGLAPDVVISALEQAAPVPGRFERVDRGQPYGAVVDYAHTPDALRNVLVEARKLNPRRLIVVFGCGGDRDRGKRPLMGRAAVELADWTIITSDNPRSETPAAVIAEIVVGAQGGAFVTEPDRRLAIELAVEAAQPGDLIVVAGKGHETYQQFADHSIDFDDRLVVAEAIEKGMARHGEDPHAR